MDPEKKYEKTPSELPQPSFNLDVAPGSSDNQAESATAMGIEKGVSSASQQMPPVSPAAAGHSRSAKQHDAVSAASAHALPPIADDNDLIEKEWVAKAKQIVEQTKHDPRAQNTEMSVVKASYIKKRFNKDIKVSESQ